MDPKILCYLVIAAAGMTRAEYSDGGFVPSFQHTEDQLAEPASRMAKREDKDSQPERTQRFGVSAYGGSGGGFGTSAPGLYGPVKIDLGGVLIGSIIGFGAVIILPKLIHVLSYTYGGGYGRSLETDFGQVSEVFNKIDEALGSYNVDSTACMQRLACSYVQLANENVVTGNATDFDVMLSSLSTNSLVHRMLDGTAVFEGISTGMSLDADCQNTFSKCKLDKKTIYKILSQMVPS